VKVLFYGRLAQAIGPDVELAGWDRGSIGELRMALAREHPHAAETLVNSRSRACVGDSFVGDDHMVGRDDRVEFLPPVSGG